MVHLSVRMLFFLLNKSESQDESVFSATSWTHTEVFEGKLAIWNYNQCFYSDGQSDNHFTVYETNTEHAGYKPPGQLLL